MPSPSPSPSGSRPGVIHNVKRLLMEGVEWVRVVRVPSLGDCPSFSLYSATWPCSTFLAVCSPPHPASVPVPVPPSSLCVDGTQGTVLGKCSITGLFLQPLLTEDRVKALNSDPPASEGHLCVDSELGNFPPTGWRLSILWGRKCGNRFLFLL